MFGVGVRRSRNCNLSVIWFKVKSTHNKENGTEAAGASEACHQQLAALEMIAGVTTKSSYFSLLGSGNSLEPAGAECASYLDGLVSRSIILIRVYVYFEGEHAHVIDKQYHIIGIINIETRASALVGVGLSLDPEGKSRSAGAHRLLAFGMALANFPNHQYTATIVTPSSSIKMRTGCLHSVGTDDVFEHPGDCAAFGGHKKYRIHFWILYNKEETSD